MIKLIAFDWNGTLLSDTWTVEKADNFILKKYGLPKITVNQFRETFQIPISRYWTALGFSATFFKHHSTEINKLFNEFYEPLADKCRTRSGVKQLLHYLKKNNVVSIIYSNHTTKEIQKQLNRLKISPYLKDVIARSADDISHMHKRGKEQKLVDYVKSLKLKPKEVVSVGDTEEEIEIGKNHGFHTVAITGGYNTTSRLKKHKPDFLIHNMLELKGIVKKLNK